MRIIQRIIVMSLVILVCGSALAGSLQPPAGPGAGTMKTLNEIEPGIPIPGGSFSTTYCITTSGRYYLAGNRTVTTDVQGIEVRCSNVTIDLTGFSLTGPGTGVSSGIKIFTDVNNIEIRNGATNHFGFSGIYAANNSRNIRTANIRSNLNCWHGLRLDGISNLIENCFVSGNQDIGIRTGANSIVSKCVVTDNNSTGIYVSKGSVVTECTSYSNNGNGIETNGGATISNCSSCENGSDGIFSSGSSVIKGNVLKNNGSRGLYCLSSSVVKENCADHNGTDGFVFAYASTVINNTAISNTENGFIINSGSAVVGNSSSWNGNCGFYLNGASLVDQNIAINNVVMNINAEISSCTVPSGNHAP